MNSVNFHSVCLWMYKSGVTWKLCTELNVRGQNVGVPAPWPICLLLRINALTLTVRTDVVERTYGPCQIYKALTVQSTGIHRSLATDLFPSDYCVGLHCQGKSFYPEQHTPPHYTPELWKSRYPLGLNRSTIDICMGISLFAVIIKQCSQPVL
jgi:hypothetical protein